MGMADENDRNSSNQQKKAVDIMKRSDGRVTETTTRYNDGTVEKTVQSLRRIYLASRGDALESKLDSLQQSRQVQLTSATTSSELPKGKPTRQEQK
jgi:hypothetical protein